MKQVFVSYAREDRAVAGDLAKRLPSLGCQVWMDVQLGGGQEWWPEVLRRIEHCDVFLAIVSRASLNSVACQRERRYAEDLVRPVVPVAVEPFSEALPQDLATRQIVDFSKRGEEAAFALAGALAALPPTPALPAVMPDAPPAPLSYLTELLTQVTQEVSLTLEQQREIVDKVEPALRSTDTNERRGGLEVLEKLTARDNYASVQRRIDLLLDQARKFDPASAAASARATAAAGSGSTGVRTARDPMGPSGDWPYPRQPPGQGATRPAAATTPAHQAGPPAQHATDPPAGAGRPATPYPAPPWPYPQGVAGSRTPQPSVGPSGPAGRVPAAPKRSTPIVVVILAVIGGIFLLLLMLAWLSS